MSESTDNKKEAASFFNSWFKPENDDWDEVCFQWCKQQRKARENNQDPECSMVCLKSKLTATKDEDSWNPFNGYAVSYFHGKKDCINHTDEMNIKKDEKVTKYEMDLGQMWGETETKAKEVIQEKVIPYYNSTLEQAKDWKESPQSEQLQNFIKERAYELLGLIDSNSSEDQKKK